MMDTVRCDVVLEQTLGHVTHSKNLERLLGEVAGVEPRFVEVPFEVDGLAARIPGYGNWTVRAGLRARGALRRAWRVAPPETMFVHTQVPAVLLGRRRRSVPTVVSLDATPLQYDELGESYAHDRSAPWIERLKFRANQRCFRDAAAIVTWSEWAKDGVVDGYGIAADKVSVIAPGVDVAQWEAPARASERDDHDPVRILFVGGDLRRKGGDQLLEACRALRADPEVPEIELHLVTPSPVSPEPGVLVHAGLTANSPELIARYHAADVFCLPTRGDCLPMVLAEAAAASLPLVSTDVGAIREIVRPGVTGELVPVDGLAELTAALRGLVLDADRRHAFGAAARRVAEDHHDARANAGRIAELLRRLARP